MTKLLKRVGAERNANSLVDGQQFQSEVAELHSGSRAVWASDYTGGEVYGISAQLFPAERADPSVIIGPVSPVDVSNVSGAQTGEKAVPFGLPCITDEKMLTLMAQDSVNGRLAALGATGSPVDASTDDEPATIPIDVGGSVTGVVDVAGDTDDLTVTLVAGQRYMISLMGSGAGPLRDPYLEIFDPSLVRVGHDDDGGIGQNSVITITAAVSGTYAIRASAFGTSGTGQYTVDVREMGTDSVPATIEGAVPIGQGITFGFRETATAVGGDDSDYYKVSLVAGKYYSFSVAAGTDYRSTFNPIAAGEIDTLLYLRGSDGAVLAYDDDIDYPSDASSSFEFQATATGDYYLQVSGFSGSGGGNTGGYVIDFHEVAPPDPLDSIDWGHAANIPTVMVDGVPTAYIYFAAAGENFGENARSGDPSQPASGTNGTLVSYGWTEYEKAQFMLAMQEYTKILGIAYVETTNSAQATFRVVTSSSYVYGAYAYPQDPAFGTQRGVMVFNVDNRGWNPDSSDPAVTGDGLGRGGFAWATILHEAGHAHGLAHPHDTGGGSTVMTGVTGPYSLGIFNLNQQIYTQMSYNDGWHTHPSGSVSNGDPSGWRADAGWLATMGAFDIAMLQARYGATPAYAAGDTVYTLQDLNGEGTYFETIYDTGGIDTIVYNGARNAQIDLNTATLDYSVTGGGIVSFVYNLPGETSAQAIKGGFTIAKGVVIENATGGNGNDLLIGNDAANVLTGGIGNDVLKGGSGNDTLDGGTGDDSMAGGEGNDIYVADSAADTVTETTGQGTDEVRTALASYTLGPNVENLTATSDIAHDFRGNGSNNVVTGGGGVDVIRLQDGGDDSAVGGGGNDQIFYGAALTAADSNNGGAGTDVVVLQGNYAVTMGAGSLVDVEFLSLQSGSSKRYQDLPVTSHNYTITFVDANVGAGQRFTVNASQLLAAESFTFNGSAETNGSFLIYGGHGTDVLTGGSGNDIFHFEGSRWGSGDMVNGGAGADSVVIRAGSGLHRIEFGETQLTNIESISVSSRFGLGGASLPSYEFVLANGNVTAGGTLIVNASSLLDPGQTLSVDGSAVRDGNLKLYGGAGADTLIGGDGNDLIYAGGGGDRMTGGEGQDVFQLRNASDSPVSGADAILDFQSGTDKIDLGFIDADSNADGNQAFTFIGSQAFSSQAGQLRAVETAPGSGLWIVSGDVDGDNNADFQISVTLADGHALSSTDFLP